MVKKFLFSFLFFFAAWPALAQNTPVTAQVIAPNGPYYAFATGAANINCPGNQQPTYNGYTLQRSIPISGFDGFGTFSVVLYDVNLIQPVGCSWKFAITDQTGIYSFTTGPIGGATQSPVISGSGVVNLTTAINAFAVPLPTSLDQIYNSNGIYTGINNFLNGILIGGLPGVSVRGIVVPGNCTDFFSATVIQDAGTPCGSGSGGGTVTPSPQYQIAYFPLSGTHGTVAGIPITTDASSDLYIPGTTGIGGPNPYVDTSSFGMRAVPTDYTATANCTAGSTTVTFTGGAYANFLTGDGLLLEYCGATNPLGTPSAPTIVPSQLSGPDTLNNSVAGPTGSTTYTYCIAGRTRRGGVTKCSPVNALTNTGVITNGLSSLGTFTSTVSTLSRSGNTVTVTTTAANDAAVGGIVFITNSTDASFSGMFVINSTNPGANQFTYTQGISTLYGGTTSASGGTATVYNGNRLTWSALTNAWQYYVYRNGTLAGVVRPGETSWIDYGPTISAVPSLPDFVPTSSPTNATNEYLPTVITAGGGSSSVTVSNAPAQSIPSVTAKFDDADALANTIIAAQTTTKAAVHISVPPVGYNYYINAHLNTTGNLYTLIGGGCMVVNETWEMGNVVWTGNQGGGCLNNPQFAPNPAQQVTVGTAFPGFMLQNPSIVDHLGFTVGPQGFIMGLIDGYGYNSQISNDSFSVTGTDYMGQGLIGYGVSTTNLYYDSFIGNDVLGYGYSLTPYVLWRDDPTGASPPGSVNCDHCYYVGRGFGADSTPPLGGGAAYRFIDTYAQANRVPMIEIGILGQSSIVIDNLIGDTSSQAVYATWGGSNTSVTLLNMDNVSAESAGKPGVVTGNLIPGLTVGYNPNLTIIGQNYSMVKTGNGTFCVNCPSSAYNFDVNGTARFRQYVDMPLISSPGNPTTGYNRFYMDSGTNLFTCLESTGTSCAPSGGSSTGFQVNGTPLISSSTVNFTNSAPFNGLTFTFTNPSNGVVQLAATGTLGNAGLANPSLTFNGQTVSLGGSGNIPFQVNGINNASLTGLNLLSSAANAVGLTATFTNPGTNQAQIEITGGTYTGTAAALGAVPSDCSGGQFATGIAANGNAICSTPAGGGNVSNAGTNLAQYEPVAGLNGTTQIATVPASFDGGLQTGATADVKLNACNSGTVTAGIRLCDDRDLPGAQTLAAPFTVGGVSGTSGVPESVVLPSVAQWTTNTSFTSSQCGLFQFGLTDIRSDSPRLRMEIINGSTTNNIEALYCNDNGTVGGGSGHPLYYGLDGVTFYNSGTSTTMAGGAAAIISQMVDGSHFTNDDFLDYAAGDAALLVKGGCCSAAMYSPVANTNYTGAIPTDWESSSSGTINGINVFSPSFDHPSSGNPNWKLNDTSAAHNSFVNAFGLYEEGANSGSAAFNALTGQGGANVFGAELKSEISSSTQCAWTVGNTFASALNLFGISMVGGGGTFTYPACLANNSNTGHVAYTDSHGYGSYTSAPFYVENLQDFGMNGFLNTYTSTHTLNTGENWVNMNCATSCNVVVPHADTGQQWHVMSIGAGAVTFAPDSGNITIAGSAPATTFVLAQNTGYIVSPDGTNTFGIGGGGGGGSIGTCTQYGVTYWATTSTLGCVVGNVTGQTLVFQNGAAPIPTSPGIGGSTITTNTGYSVQCDSSTTTLDRLKTLIFTNASGDTVTVPDAGTTGCGSNFTFAIGAGPGAGAITVNRTSSSSFTVLNGSTALASQTTFSLTAGEYATVSSPDNSNYIVRISQGGSGITLETNGGSNSNQSVLNLLNSTAFNGLTGTFTNTIGGNVQFGFSGTLGNAGLTNSSITLNGQNVALGATGNIPFQVNGTPNTSLAGLNFINASAFNGLTLSLSNPATNQVQPVFTGTLNNSGLTNSSVTVNGCAVALGASCNIPIQTNGTNNTSQAGLNLQSSSTFNGMQVTITNTSSDNATLGLTGIADTTFTNATTALSGNTCSASATTVTMTGVTTAMTFSIAPSTDVSGSTGWGASGGLVIVAWPTSNTLNYKLCNQTSGSITPAAVVWNVSAR